MNLQNVFVLSCLVILTNAATINSPPELNRQKRTIQYFLDGLFSGLTDRRPMIARNVNDHRTSTLISLAKLSSGSTPSKNVQTFDDDDHDESIIENTLNLSHEKSPLIIQLPIPSIASAFLKSTENRVPQTTMSMRVEMDVQPIKQSIKNVTKTPTVAPNQMPTTTAAPDQSQIPTITLNTTVAPNQTQTNTSTTTTTTTTTTEEPNQTESIVSEATTIQPDTSTDSLEITTEPIESNMIHSKSLSSNTDEVPTKMEKRNAPMKASDLHTARIFDGPLAAENDRNALQKPIYSDDCVEIHCNKDIGQLVKDISVLQSRILPSSRIAPIISMTIALPISTSGIEQSRLNGQAPIRNYNVFTLHTIPIYSDVNSKRLSNEIADPPTSSRTAHSNT